PGGLAMSEQRKSKDRPVETCRPHRRTFLTLALGFVGLSACSSPNSPTQSTNNPTVITGAGDITAVVEQYRALLGGPNNGATPGALATGRREINWDGVPDDLATPNFLPADFFNARGAQLSTPGLGVQVSADSNNPLGTPVRFGNFNPAYAASFKT